MRVQSVTFHNFRRLINTRLKLGDNITVLVGQNESGKSTILEGLYNTTHINHDSNLTRSFSKLKDEKEFEIRVVLEVNENDLKGILKLAGLSPEIKDKYLVNQKLVFEWKGHNSDETRIVHSKWEGLKVRYGNNSRYDSIMRQLTIYVNHSIILLRPDHVIPDSEPFMDASNLVFENINDYSLNHVYSLKATEGHRFTALQNDVKKFFKNTDFNIIKKDSHLEVIIVKYFQGREKQFTLSEMSDGFRKLLSILVKILVFEPQLILLDEPDTNLHSNLVRDLITYLKNLDIQTIIATHDEILINEFKEKDVKYVYPISAISSKIKDYSMFNLNQVFADLGLNLKYKKSLLLSNQLIILLEGDDDEQFLNKLLDKTQQRERLKNFSLAIETTGGNKIIDLDIIDKLNKNPIPVLLVRDGDERPNEKKQEITTTYGNRLHIWKRREIENYVLSLNAILSALKSKSNCSEVSNLKLIDVEKMVQKLAQLLTNKIAILMVYAKYKKNILN